jgi:hypothetical protein
MRKKPYKSFSEETGKPSPSFVSADFIVEMDRLQEENKRLKEELLLRTEYAHLPLDSVRCIKCYTAGAYARIYYGAQLEWDTDNEEINAYCLDCFVKMREQAASNEEEE